MKNKKQRLKEKKEKRRIKNFFKQVRKDSISFSKREKDAIFKFLKLFFSTKGNERDIFMQEFEAQLTERGIDVNTLKESCRAI